MSHDDHIDPSSQRPPRVPLERRVSLKFRDLDGFLTEYSDNISLGGMFVKTKQPQPPGSLFDFELTLAPEVRLIQGIGQVAWVREHDEGPDRPAGMGVRFLDLDSESRRLIFRIVDEHIVQGGEPFDLDREAPAARSGGDEVLSSLPREAEPAPEERETVTDLDEVALWEPPPRRRRRGPLWLAAGVVLIVAAAAGAYYLRGGWRPPAAPARAERPAPAATRPSVPPATPMPAVETPSPVASPDAIVTPAATAEGATVPPPAATPPWEPSPPPTAAPPPLSLLDDVRWSREGDRLVVTLVADAPFTPENYSLLRLEDGKPRELVRIVGVLRAFGRTSIPVGEPELERIRVGYHERAEGDELHVVLDLGSPGIHLEDAAAEGNRLRLTLAR